MPTFFARRYMRGRPGPVERLLGAALLVLTAVVVFAFLATTGYLGDRVLNSRWAGAVKVGLGMPTRPLFTADPRHLKPPPPPHEYRTAENLLPPDLAGWKRASLFVVPLSSPEGATSSGVDIPPIAATGGEKETDLPAIAGDYRSLWLFSAAYRRPDRSETLTLTIVDAGTPAHAFGLWRAREPAEGRRIPLGREAWVCSEKGRLGIRAGRYYTECNWSEPLTAGEAETVARAVAGLQLAYGGPFWAERVLPTEQRIERSFRFVCTRPLGLDALADAWLADYTGGWTLAVMQVSAKRRDAILRELATQMNPLEPSASSDDMAASAYGASETGSNPSVADAYAGDAGDSGYPASGEGSGDKELQADLAQAAGASSAPEGSVMGRWGGTTIAAFPAGEYLFVVAAPEATVITPLIQSLKDRHDAHPPLAGAVRSPVGSANAAATAGQAYFPDLGDPSILAPTRIERYTDNLYEKINGRESQFRAFHVVELRFAQYLDTRRQQAFDVYLYDMAEPPNALGIYMKERSGEVQELSIGRGGYASGSATFFWKGRYYVSILGPADGDERDARLSQSIAAAIATTIADDGQPLWGELLLPQEDRVPHSFTYQATGVLGHQFLEGAFLAGYRTRGQDYQLFVLRAPSAEAADRLFRQYAEATARYDRIVGQSDPDNDGLVVSESMGIFAAVFCKGPYLGGAIECPDQMLALEAARKLREQLP